MNYLRTLMLGLGVLLVALFSVTIVHAEGEIVTVLFPTAAGSGTHKISADESDPIKSTGTATLSVDLNLLPATAIVKRVTIQLAGKSVEKDNPQIVTIVPQGSTKPVASWTATSGESVFQASTELLASLGARGAKGRETRDLDLLVKESAEQLGVRLDVQVRGHFLVKTSSDR